MVMSRRSVHLITLLPGQALLSGLPGPEVIKFEYSLKLKIKRNDTCPQNSQSLRFIFRAAIELATSLLESA